MAGEGLPSIVFVVQSEGKTCIADRPKALA